MPPENLLGTWKLVSAVREEVPSGAKVDLFGPNPVGYLSYAPDGRMLALIVRGERVTPAGANANARRGRSALPQHAELRRHL